MCHITARITSSKAERLDHSSVLEPFMALYSPRDKVQRSHCGMWPAYSPISSSVWAKITSNTNQYPLMHPFNENPLGPLRIQEEWSSVKPSPKSQCASTLADGDVNKQSQLSTVTAVWPHSGAAVSYPRIATYPLFLYSKAAEFFAIQNASGSLMPTYLSISTLSPAFGMPFLSPAQRTSMNPSKRCPIDPLMEGLPGDSQV